MEFSSYRDVFQSIPSPYMILDRDLRYVAANDAYAATTGRTIAELIGERLFDLFPNEGESGRLLSQSLQRVLATGKSDTLAYLPYAIPRSDGAGFEARYWSAVHVPLFGETGAVEYIVQNTVDVTDLHRAREASVLPFRPLSGESELLQRAREMEKAHRTLLAESADFRRLFEQAPGMIAVLSGPRHVFTFTDESYTHFIGGREVTGMSVRDALPEVEGQGFFEMLDTVYRTGEPVGAKGARVMLRKSGKSELGEAFLDFSYQPIFDPEGKINGIFVQGTDQTDNVRAGAARELLVRELNHRVKNLFTVAISMVNMTARNAPSPQDMAQVLSGRLGALSHAHSLVMRDSGPNGADSARIAFRDMLEKIVAPYLLENGVDVVMDGPEIVLGPKAATSLALVMHELATNAAKYGAMTQSGGRIEMTWSISGARVEMTWRETGGPRIVGMPEPSGFGSRLARISVEGQLEGAIDFAWPQDGVVVSISFPVDKTSL